MPVRINSNWRLASLPTSSVMRSRSRATICEALATESLDKPVALAGRSTLPGASPKQDCWLMALRRRYGYGFDSVHRLGQQSPVFGIGTGRVWQVCPVHMALGKLPFDRFEDTSGSSCQGWVGSRINHLANPVHRFGHGLRIVPRDIFGYRLGVDLAARFFQSPGQPFGLREYLIGNGNRRFHTRSMTGSWLRASDLGEGGPGDSREKQLSSDQWMQRK